MPDLPGVTHRYLDVRGIRVHVAEAGSGEPVLLLHGWPQHWWQWRHMVTGLADRFRLICPDQRGFGWSEAPPHASYLKEELADDAVALMDTLGLERVHLVGHDWGGVAGFLLCLRHPERIRRYVALNTAHPYVSLDRATMRQLWRLWYQYVIAAPGLGERLVAGGDQRFLRFLGPWVGGGWTWGAEDTEIYLSQLREPERARASVAMYRTYQLREVTPTLGGRYKHTRLKTPTLFLHGARDRVIHPELLRGYERFADDLTLELVPDAGHWIAEQRPELVSARRREFLG